MIPLTSLPKMKLCIIYTLLYATEINEHIIIGNFVNLQKKICLRLLLNNIQDNDHITSLLNSYS